MIELPEALTLAKQMNETLQGKQVGFCVRGNSPMKFAFYTRPEEEYVELLKNKRVGQAVVFGNEIFLPMQPDYTLVLGGGGERIFYHENETTIPKKHQLLLGFADQTFLTVSIQMWGSVKLFSQSELVTGKNYYGYDLVSPLSDDFSLDYFKGLFAALPAGAKDALKFFLISKPGVSGLGNGYLQDILFNARIHPKRRAIELSAEQQGLLHETIRDVMRRATDAGGRSDELDLFGKPGGYQRILDSQAAGKPCPRCGTLVEKIQFMGGASYYCPSCQVN